MNEPVTMRASSRGRMGRPAAGNTWIDYLVLTLPFLVLAWTTTRLWGGYFAEEWVVYCVATVSAGVFALLVCFGLRGRWYQREWYWLWSPFALLLALVLLLSPDIANVPGNFGVFGSGCAGPTYWPIDSFGCCLIIAVHGLLWLALARGFQLSLNKITLVVTATYLVWWTTASVPIQIAIDSWLSFWDGDPSRYGHFLPQLLLLVWLYVVVTHRSGRCWNRFIYLPAVLLAAFAITNDCALSQLQNHVVDHDWAPFPGGLGRNLLGLFGIHLDLMWIRPLYLASGALLLILVVRSTLALQRRLGHRVKAVFGDTRFGVRGVFVAALLTLALWTTAVFCFYMIGGLSLNGSVVLRILEADDVVRAWIMLIALVLTAVFIGGLLLRRHSWVRSERSSLRTWLRRYWLHLAISGGISATTIVLVVTDFRVTGLDYALCEAVRHSNLVLARDSLAQGADPRITRDDGSGLLHVAVMKGSAAMVSLLVSEGAPVNGENRCGGTPLYLMFEDRFDYPDEIQEKALTLLEHGARIDCTCSYSGDTLLGNAIVRSPASLEMLLSGCRDPVDKARALSVRDTRGRSLYDLAVATGDTETMTILVRHGAGP